MKKKVMEVKLSDYLQLSQIAHRWQECRDSVWRLFTISGETRKIGEEEYYLRMKELQLIIKAYARDKKIGNNEAAIEMGTKEEDVRWVIQILAAAYDLSVGNDHTIEKNKDDNKEA